MRCWVNGGVGPGLLSWLWSRERYLFIVLILMWVATGVAMLLL